MSCSMAYADAARYLIPEWLQRLYEDCEAEGHLLNSQWPLKLLDMTTRRLVWTLCSKLFVSVKGVPGQVCRLTETYIAIRCQKKCEENVPKEEFDEFKLELASRLPLIIASAIQLSAKMASMGDLVRTCLLKAALAERGVVYSEQIILKSEIDVLKTLNFRLPLWTSVEASELYATYLNLPPVIMRGVAIVTDIAEFHRYQIEAEVIKRAVTFPQPYAHGSLRTIHLCAGAVIAASRHLQFAGPDPVQTLSVCTNAPSSYLLCVSSVIENYLEYEVIAPPLLAKRRRLFQNL